MHGNGDLRLRELVGFYAPLAANNLIILSTHALIIAGLARTSVPLVAVAAFALARSVFHLFENPLFTVRQLTVVFATSPRGAARTLRWVMGISGAIALLVSLLSFGPWAAPLIGSMFGVDGEVAVEAVRAMQLLSVAPLIIGYRSFNQGLLIRCRSTLSLPIATLIRLVLVAIWVAIVPRFPGWSASAGAAALITAIAVETTFIVVRTRQQMAPHRELPWTSGAVAEGYRTIALFSLPLTVMTLLHCATNPLINLGLGRLPEAVTAVAAFAVGDSLARMALSPCNSLNQLVMVYGGTESRRRQLRRLVVGSGAVLSGLLILLSFTVIDQVIVRWMGLDGKAAEQAGWVFRVMACQPLVVCIREYHWGVLYRRRQTSAIGFGKAVNLVLLCGALVIGFTVLPLSGAVVGAAALLLGEVAETLTVARLETIDARARLGDGS